MPYEGRYPKRVSFRGPISLQLLANVSVTCTAELFSRRSIIVAIADMPTSRVIAFDYYSNINGMLKTAKELKQHNYLAGSGVPNTRPVVGVVGISCGYQGPKLQIYLRARHKR